MIYLVVQPASEIQASYGSTALKSSSSETLLYPEMRKLPLIQVSQLIPYVDMTSASIRVMSGVRDTAT